LERNRRRWSFLVGLGWADVLWCFITLVGSPTPYCYFSFFLAFFFFSADFCYFCFSSKRVFRVVRVSLASFLLVIPTAIAFTFFCIIACFRASFMVVLDSTRVFIAMTVFFVFSIHCSTFGVSFPVR